MCRYTLATVLRRLAVLIVLGAALFMAPSGGWVGRGSAALACPNCSNLLSGENTGDRDSASSTPGPGNRPVAMAKGYYYSILLMLAVPFLLVSGLSGMLYVTMRRADHHAQGG